MSPIYFDLIEVTNFMGVPYRLIKFDHRSAYIMGPNGVGKSSIISAMRSPLDSSFTPAEPVNANAESGSGMIRIVLSDNGRDTVYEIGAAYNEKNKTGKLTLHENGQEVKTSVKTRIKSIIGNITFDIYEWLEMSTAKKIEALKKLSGKAEEINAVEAEIASAKKALEAVTTLVEDAEVMLKKENRPFTDEDMVTYEVRVDEEAIQKELEGLRPAIDNWNKVTNGVAESKRSVAAAKVSISKLEAESLRVIEEIERLKKSLVGISDEINELKSTSSVEEDKIKRGEEWLASHKEPNLSDINERLTNARQHNAKHAQIEEYRKKHTAMLEKRSDKEIKKKALEKLVEKKRSIIASSQLPVEGLYFDDDDVYFEGLPLHDGQINTAKIEEIGIDIACAMNSNLRCVFIKNGSLMDTVTRHRIVKKLESRGLQFIMEVVDDKEEGLTVSFEEEDRS